MVYLYDGWKIIETRDGSSNVKKQFIHGIRYIDELIMMRVIDKGDLYIHQDANWNVVALTDLGGHVVERNIYTPYGELTVHQETSFGDRDGDQDVDATDKGTPGSTCTGTVSGACRILDLDFDGDYDSTDATKFDNLPQGPSRHPGRMSTGVDQPFGHQGLLYEPELGQYQNRHRQYDPLKRRFLQRDPLAFRFGRFSARRPYQDGMNSYSYQDDNPFRWVDPSGLFTPCDVETGEGAEGWIECDANGNSYPCVNPGIGDPCVAECVELHEQEHADHIVCECDTCVITGYLQRCPGRNQGPTPICGPGSECAAYRLSRACLDDCPPSDEVSISIIHDDLGIALHCTYQGCGGGDDDDDGDGDGDGGGEDKGLTQHINLGWKLEHR